MPPSASGADRDRRAVRRELEHVERTEVDGAGDLRRRRCVPDDGELRRHAGAARRGPQLRDQPARLKERREDPGGEFLDLRQRPSRFTLELVQERPRPGGIALQRACHDLQVSGETDQVLLHALVESALDAAPLGVGRRRESCPRRSELLDLVVQPVEHGLFVDLPGSQGTSSRA